MTPLGKPSLYLRRAVGKSIQRARRTLSLGASETLRLAIGVSGGEDSRVLLHCLAALRSELGLEIIVCHLDHALREESANDAQFVAALADAAGLAFMTQRADRRDVGQNIEAWARRVRYDFLEQCRRETSAHFVVTAHHAADQAETFFMRLVSGRLATRSYAICECSKDRRLLRPLLRVTKNQLALYFKEHGLSSVIDSTNEDLCRTRNRIRHEVLPFLKRAVNPSTSETLSVVAARVADDEDFVWEQARRTLAESSGSMTWRQVVSLAPALAWRVLQILAEAQIGERALSLGYEALNSTVEFCRDGFCGTKVLELGRGVRCRLESDGKIVFTYKAFPRTQSEVIGTNVRLTVPGVVVRRYADGSEAEISAKLVYPESFGFELGSLLLFAENQSPDCAARAFFDFDKLGADEFTVRERRPGDVLSVWGRGRRKVKKLLQERSLNLTLRDRIPIVELRGNIVWIPGVARSQIAPVEHSSRLVLELTYQRRSAEVYPGSEFSG